MLPVSLFVIKCSVKTVKVLPLFNSVFFLVFHLSAYYICFASAIHRFALFCFFSTSFHVQSWNEKTNSVGRLV